MNKYQRQVPSATIDVYDILKAWGVTCPATQHAIKKLLQPGERGHKDKLTDLHEALASVQRAIEMAEDDAVVNIDDVSEDESKSIRQVYGVAEANDFVVEASRDNKANWMTK